MKKHTNLVVFLILAGLLLASICSLIWQVKRSLEEVHSAQKKLNVAPAPAAPQAEPEPVSTAAQLRPTVALAPATTSSAYASILSEQELLRRAKRELAPFFPPDQLEEMAKRTQHIVLYPTVIAAGTKIIHEKYPKDTPQFEQLRTKQLHALQQTVFAIRERKQKNDLLNKRFQEGFVAWFNQLPLQRKNLSADGPKGQKTFRRAACPTQDKQLGRCELVSYADGSFSMLFFRQDVLSVRRDYAADNTLLTDYRFFPPPDYLHKDTPANQRLAQGMISQKTLWDGTHPQPALEETYQENGLLKKSKKRLFDRNILQETQYDNKGFFSSFTEEGIDASSAQKEPQRLSLMMAISSPNRPSFPTGGTYKRQGAAAFVVGSWTADDDGTVTLDDGRRFPPAQSFPRAPLYRDIYPAQVPAAQTAPELL